MRLSPKEQDIYDYLLSVESVGTPVATAYRNWRYAMARPDVCRILNRAALLVSAQPKWTTEQSGEAREMLSMYPSVIQYGQEQDD